MIFASLTISGNDIPDLCPLPIGSMAPYFSGIDQYGHSHSLETFKEKGPAVLFFYTGYWCQFCIKKLESFQKELCLLKSKGINVIVITQEGEEFRNHSIPEMNQDIPVLVDFNHSIMKTYKVAHKVEVLERNLNNLEIGSQGIMSENDIIAIPATYIITKTGIIDYVDYDPNQKRRVDIQEILKHLRA